MNRLFVRCCLIAALMCVAALLSMPVFAQDAVLEENLVDGCVTDFDPDVDYFPQKVSVDYAEGFTVEYFNNYKLVTILTPWQNADETFEYVLVQCGTPAPEGYDTAQIIEVPVERIITMSTSILPHLDTQGVLNRLVGVDTVLYTSNSAVVAKAEAGELAEIGGGGSFTEVNVELVLDLEPDLIMTQQFSAGSGSLNVLEATGVPIVLNSDFVDMSPLGQAEWGKYIALYFNTEAAATEAFLGGGSRYQALAELTRDIEDRPTVFAASAYDGTWYMPGGHSTIAQLLDDAGADFLWADVEGTSVPVDFETVLDRAIDAEFWVNINQFWATTEDALAADERYGEFAAFRSGNLWNNNARMNINGGSDYFETGFANPDLILADLIAIFHPDLLPDHELFFYQRLESGNS